MTLKCSDLRDDFQDNIFSATAWPANYATGSASGSETGGQAVFTLPSSTAGAHEAAYATPFVYNLTGDQSVLNIAQMVSTSVAAYAFFQLRLDATSNYLQWLQQSGTLKAQKVVAGVTTDLYSVAWSAATYKYLRIRESGGTIFFDSSLNGTTWTQRASTTVASAFPVTALAIYFGAGCGNVASPGALKIEDYNLLLGLTTSWHWTQAEWPLFWRFRNITLSASGGQACIAFASSIDASGNLVSPTYYSGPLGSDGRTLTQQSGLAAAQAMAVNLPSDNRWELPAMVECRFIRLYHRSIVNGSSNRLDEYYPRRLDQADDFEGEVFRGLRFEGHQFVCDYLSALSANIGGLVIDPTGYLWQGTGTAASPNTGLKIFNSGGIGKLSTYNGGVEQVTLDTDGKLKAGAGNVALDSTGINLATPSSYLLSAALSFRNVNGTVGSVHALSIPGGGNTLYVSAYQTGTLNNSNVNISGQGAGGTASIAVIGGATSALVKNTHIATTHEFNGNMTLTGPLTATGAGLSTFGGNLSLIPAISATADCRLALGELAAGLAGGNRNTFIDFVADPTNVTYGLRFIRTNTGANAVSAIYHRGTGVFNIVAQDAGSIALATNNAARLTINSAGAASFASTIQTAKNITWDMGNYTAGAVTATGTVSVTIAGVARRLLCA